ncbi:MAG TPA: tetratricopeptide repeat protein [Gemmatimonadaceae bacterium]|nr:tetratricopeptide repeat protein [Gemmatimonadaceae bacterium]
MRGLRLILPVALAATGGCLATRSDVEQLQLGVNAMRDSMRAQQARSDSTTRALIREMSQQLGQQFSRQFATLSDSVRDVSAGLQRLQGDLSLAMHDLNTQMVAVQEGIGVSQKRLSELRSSVEAIPAVPPTATMPMGAAPGNQGRGGAPPQAGTTASPASPAAPPPGTLWMLGRDALAKGATASARENFQTLVTSYPDHERAPDAQMYIGDAFASEGNKPAADSVYALVVTKYPGSAQAARSLYKRAQFAIEVGDKTRARTLLQELADKYPRSNEALLVGDLLKSLNKP